LNGLEIIGFSTEMAGWRQNGAFEFALAIAQGNAAGSQ
jgi:hypothetical protein